MFEIILVQGHAVYTQFTGVNLWELKNTRDTVTIKNRTHAERKSFHHEDVRNSLYPKVMPTTHISSGIKAAGTQTVLTTWQYA